MVDVELPEARGRLDDEREDGTGDEPIVVADPRRARAGAADVPVEAVPRAAPRRAPAHRAAADAESRERHEGRSHGHLVQPGLAVDIALQAIEPEPCLLLRLEA